MRARLRAGLRVRVAPEQAEELRVRDGLRLHAGLDQKQHLRPPVLDVLLPVELLELLQRLAGLVRVRLIGSGSGSGSG